MNDGNAGPKMAEWCLFFIDWEPICMPRDEWSGWAQAIGSIVGLAIAIGMPYWQLWVPRRDASRTARALASDFIMLLEQLLRQPAETYNVHLALTAEARIAEILSRGKEIPTSVLHHTQSHGLQSLLAQARIVDKSVKSLLGAGEPAWPAFHRYLTVEIKTARTINSMVVDPNRRKRMP